MKNFLLKFLGFVLLGTIVLGLSGCASSDSDLGYERKNLDNSGDPSYHGWNSVPKETSQ